MQRNPCLFKLLKTFSQRNIIINVEHSSYRHKSWTSRSLLLSPQNLSQYRTPRSQLSFPILCSWNKINWSSVLLEATNISSVVPVLGVHIVVQIYKPVHFSLY